MAMACVFRKEERGKGLPEKDPAVKREQFRSVTDYGIDVAVNAGVGREIPESNAA